MILREMNSKELPRFLKRVNKTDSCWIWTGGKTYNGYGVCSLFGRQVQVTHVALKHWRNIQVPKGFEADHLCRVRACVNPYHLEVVTHKENMRRSSLFLNGLCKRGHDKNGRRYCYECAVIRNGGRRRKANFCRQGHDLTILENIYQGSRNGVAARVCKPCRQAYMKLRRQRKAILNVML